MRLRKARRQPETREEVQSPSHRPQLEPISRPAQVLGGREICRRSEGVQTILPQEANKRRVCSFLRHQQNPARTWF